MLDLGRWPHRNDLLLEMESVQASKGSQPQPEDGQSRLAMNVRFAGGLAPLVEDVPSWPAAGLSRCNAVYP